MRPIAELEKLINYGKHFCIAPWVHLNVTTFGNMSQCNQVAEWVPEAKYGNLNEHSFEELWQGEEIRRLRLQLLNDKPDPRCLRCYEQARLGCWNQRQNLNDLYAHKHLEWVANTDSQGYAPDAKPIYWNIKFSNRCNLRCRTCSYYSSSGWFKDTKNLGTWDSQLGKAGSIVNGIADPDRLLHDLDPYLPFLDRIYFEGGEPLLMKGNYRILELLDSIRKYDLEIFFTTNLNQLGYGDHNILSIWPKFKKLYISVSLDGLGPKCEYLRKGLRWPKALEHLTDIKRNCPNAYIYINYTVSVFNVLHLPDFHREMVEKGFIAAHQINLILLDYPHHYNIKILPPEMKREVTGQLEGHIKWLQRQTPFNKPEGRASYAQFFNQWKSCIDYLNDDDWTRWIPEFIKFTDTLDELRHENCLAIFPELRPIYAFAKE